MRAVRGLAGLMAAVVWAGAVAAFGSGARRGGRGRSGTDRLVLGLGRAAGSRLRIVKGFHRPARCLPVGGWLGLAAAGLVFVACGPPDGFVGAADVVREAEAARVATPLPPGATWPPLPSLDPGGAYQTGHGRFVVESQAECAWFRYWAEAMAKDDQAAIDRASAMWDRIRTWSPFANTDAAGRRYLESVVERARLGDPSGLLQRVKGCA